MDKALTLRLPADIYDRAAETAEAMGLSLSAYIRLALIDHTRWKRKEQAPAVRQRATVARGPAEHGEAVPRAAEHLEQRPSLNGPCPCGSGLKYKRCHGAHR